MLKLAYETIKAKDPNIVVISGMARGADVIAHRSALDNGGRTLAVLPYGIKHVEELAVEGKRVFVRVDFNGASTRLLQEP